MSGEKKKKKNAQWKLILAVLVGGALLVSLGIYAPKEHIYREAQGLIGQGEYDKAYDALQSLEESDYRDTGALIRFCRVHSLYAQGDIKKAWGWVKSPAGQLDSESQQAEYMTLRAKVEEEYDAFMEAERERKEQEYRNKVRNGVPFVGMSENDIRYTSLGAPASKVRHNNEVSNGKIYQATLYDFYDGNALIFTARCVRGIVTEVWDSRDNPVVQKPYSPKSTAKPETDDPYDAQDYSHPDDFYYDHYDDFFDYYDAEDYWYGHHD